ncbi:MAG: hypothetical protein D3910_02425 [Candidatus Electrothrix sp. ATG2]|nr:hypothetical protein [Candidatus Electrothrix sp. ATG2]
MRNLKAIFEMHNCEKAAQHSEKFFFVSTQIDLKAKIKLQIISTLFDERQASMPNKLVEASINEVFDQVELTEELAEDFQCTMVQAGIHQSTCEKSQKKEMGCKLKHSLFHDE